MSSFVHSRRLWVWLVSLVLLVLLEARCGGSGPFEFEDPVTALIVIPDTVRLLAGQMTVLSARFVHQSGSQSPAEAVVWVSLKESVATVNDAGHVSAVAAGRAEILAVAEGKTARAVIKVPGWFLAASMPEARRAGHAAALNGRLYYVGGNATMSEDYVASTFVFDPRTDTWNVSASMPTARDQGAIAIAAGALYVIGGINPNAPNNGLSRLDQNEGLDAAGTWQTRAAMPTARGAMRADTLNGRIHVVGGGTSGLDQTDVLEIYDPVANTWVAGAPIPTLRQTYGIGTIGSKLYVAGGQEADRDPTGVLDVFDGSTGTWSAGPAMPTARFNVASAVLERRLVVAGGENTVAGQLAVVEAFDPVTGAWASLPALPVARREASAAVLEGILYVLGGVVSPGVVTNRVDAYIP